MKMLPVTWWAEQQQAGVAKLHSLACIHSLHENKTGTRYGADMACGLGLFGNL